MTAPARQAGRSGLARRRRRAAWLFLAPMLVALAAVAGWPLARTISLAFTDATLGGVEPARFVGLANLAALARDPDWWRAVGNTVVFATVSVALETVLGTLVALVLDASLPGRAVVRAAVLVPWAIPTVVSAQLWAWMYNDLSGVVNAALLGLGVLDAPRAWTAEPALALGAVIAVDVWKTTPYVALLVLAALQLVPRELHEAARLEGASAARIFRSVTLPIVRPALWVAVVFRALDALRVFDLPYVLTGSGRSTATMSVFTRQQLVDFQDVGYGSAAAAFLFVAVLGLAAVWLALARVRAAGEGG